MRFRINNFVLVLTNKELASLSPFLSIIIIIITTICLRRWPFMKDLLQHVLTKYFKLRKYRLNLLALYYNIAMVGNAGQYNNTQIIGTSKILTYVDSMTKSDHLSKLNSV